MDPSLHHKLEAAEGYLGLEMPKEALEELEGIPEEFQQRQDVRLIRLYATQATKDWEGGTRLARELVDQYPECSEAYIAGAYAIRRHESLTEAHAFLLSGESHLQDAAIFFFNMACYKCQMDEEEEAKSLLRKAITMDSHYRRLAYEDEDLDPLRDFIRAQWPKES